MWIARSKDGTLRLFKTKPERIDEEGCWVGRIHIESCFEEDTDDDEYYMKLVKHMK